MLSLLLLIPLIGIFVIYTDLFNLPSKNKLNYTKNIKNIALFTSIVNLIISLIVFLLFDYTNNQFQFVQEYHQISHFHFYLGIDGLSIYFVLLTTMIIPISLLSN